MEMRMYRVSVLGGGDCSFAMPSQLTMYRRSRVAPKGGDANGPVAVNVPTMDGQPEGLPSLRREH
jgi:hypothetical protein